MVGVRPEYSALTPEQGKKKSPQQRLDSGISQNASMWPRNVPAMLKKHTPQLTFGTGNGHEGYEEACLSARQRHDLDPRLDAVHGIDHQPQARAPKAPAEHDRSHAFNIVVWSHLAQAYVLKCITLRKIPMISLLNISYLN